MLSDIFTPEELSELRKTAEVARTPFAVWIRERLLANVQKKPVRAVPPSTPSRPKPSVYPDSDIVGTALIPTNEHEDEEAKALRLIAGYEARQYDRCSG